MIAGLDLGTTGSKIVIYDNKGNFVDKFYKSYKTDRKNSDTGEIDGKELISTVKSLVGQACNKYRIDAIGVDSFGEAFVMLDKNDEALGNIMVQSDSRGKEEVQYLISKISATKIEKITGITPHQTYSLPKIMWIKNNKPDLFNKCKRILMMEDYAIYSLTGNAFIDYTLATRSLAFDIKNLTFSKEILDAAGIDISLFSKPVPLFHNCGKIKDSIKKEFGIKNNVVITTSGHDQIAVALGSGTFQKKTAVDGAGTVECITPIFGDEANFKLLIKNNYAVVPYIKKGTFVTYAYSYTSGSLIDWFINTFSRDLGNKSFEILEKEFLNGPTNLLVLPHFSGAACPYMDNDSRGAIVGLSLSNTLSNIYQAVLEGIAYEMKINIDALKKSGVEIKRLNATGGGSASKKWLQIKSDILNLPIDILLDKESGSRGSAMSAGIVLGIFKNTSEAAKVMIKKVGTVVPNKANHEKYTKVFERYKKLYKAVKGVL